MDISRQFTHTEASERLEELLHAREVKLLEDGEDVELEVIQNVLDDCYDEYINEDIFTEYITNLIQDCYEVKESSEWPYRHMTMDYVAAAEEAKDDYTEVSHTV